MQKPQQHAQAAKKAIYKGFGMTFRMSSKNFAYLNDSLCAIDEDNKDATVYQSGLYNVIVYHHTGKVALMKEGQFVGYLMKEQRKIPLTHIMIIGAFIFAFLQDHEPPWFTL